LIQGDGSTVELGHTGPATGVGTTLGSSLASQCSWQAYVTQSSHEKSMHVSWGGFTYLRMG